MTLAFRGRAFTKVDGVHIHWSEMGRGHPLVLLHGLSDSHRTWLRVAPLLARSRRVILPDLAGHGLSERPDASYSLEWHARMVTGLLQALDLSSLDLVGHSYGGGIGLTMLLDESPQIRRLALVAAGGFGREVGLALRLASLPGVETLGQPFMPLGTRLALSAESAYAEEEIAQLSAANSTPGTARAFARSVRDVIDWRGQKRHVASRLHELRQKPTIGLFWGDCDTVIPFTHAAQAASIFEGARIHRFTGCGHFPHRQCPEAFVSALGEFLRAPGLRRTRVLTGAPAAQVARSALLGSTAPLAPETMPG